MTQPSPQSQLVSRTIVPGRYRRSAGTVTSSGPSRKLPASRSSIAPKTDGQSRRGRHIHSMPPLGATSAVTSQSEMARPEVASDHEQLTKLAREQRTLREMVNTYEEYKRALHEAESAREMLKHEKDPEMQEYLRSEERRAATQAGEGGERLKVLLLPKDPNDERDVIVEIQGAEGGG